MPRTIHLSFSIQGLADVCEAMENLIEAVLEDDFSDDLAMVGRIADVISQVCLPLFDTSVGCGDMTSLENNRVGSVFLPSILPITQEYACILIC